MQRQLSEGARGTQGCPDTPVPSVSALKVKGGEVPTRSESRRLPRRPRLSGNPPRQNGAVSVTAVYTFSCPRRSEEEEDGGEDGCGRRGGEMARVRGGGFGWGGTEAWAEEEEEEVEEDGCSRRGREMARVRVGASGRGGTEAWAEEEEEEEVEEDGCGRRGGEMARVRGGGFGWGGTEAWAEEEEEEEEEKDGPTTGTFAALHLQGRDRWNGRVRTPLGAPGTLAMAQAQAGSGGKQAGIWSGALNRSPRPSVPW
ncbi:unnamed protein product [Arctogadus glacialis]